MVVLLRIYDTEYNVKGDYVEDTAFNGNIAKSKVILRKSFKSYVDMANFLDENEEKYKNKVMFIRNSNEVGLSRKVVFDGVNCWVENYGNIWGVEYRWLVWWKFQKKMKR